MSSTIAYIKFYIKKLFLDWVRVRVMAYFYLGRMKKLTPKSGDIIVITVPENTPREAMQALARNLAKSILATPSIPNDINIKVVPHEVNIVIADKLEA